MSFVMMRARVYNTAIFTKNRVERIMSRLIIHRHCICGMTERKSFRNDSGNRSILTIEQFMRCWRSNFQYRRIFPLMTIIIDMYARVANRPAFFTKMFWLFFFLLYFIIFRWVVLFIFPLRDLRFFFVVFVFFSLVRVDYSISFFDGRVDEFFFPL